MYGSMTVEVLAIKFRRCLPARHSEDGEERVAILEGSSGERLAARAAHVSKRGHGINSPGCPALRWWPQRNPAKARNQPVKLLSQRRMQVQALDSGLIVIGVRLTVQYVMGRR